MRMHSAALCSLLVDIIVEAEDDVGDGGGEHDDDDEQEEGDVDESFDFHVIFFGQDVEVRKGKEAGT